MSIYKSKVYLSTTAVFFFSFLFFLLLLFFNLEKNFDIDKNRIANFNYSKQNEKKKKTSFCCFVHMCIIRGAFL